MAARIDRELARLLRRLAEWQQKPRTASNASMLDIGERAILTKIRELGKQRKAVA